MKNFTCDAWDRGRLTVNADFAALLRRHQLTTFDAIWDFSLQAQPAKMLRTDRVTLRFELTDSDGTERTFYIKRHGRSTWKEYLKPWLHGQRPLLGAQPEWDALIAFHACGLPTMMPVACGRHGERSFLITEGLTGCEKLSAILPDRQIAESERRRLIKQVAELARKMHSSRLHHQDFYLGHLLTEASTEPDHSARLYVIDLGRARPHGPFFARRWRVKDLAQLNYSARGVRKSERLRFLVNYFYRPLQPSDRGLIRSIAHKTARIARHSGKNRL